MIKVWIIEDETAAARRLTKLLKEVSPDVEVVQHLDSVSSTLEHIREQILPDLIFLDIHLADGPCFEIFRHQEIYTPIIFTTAYDKYAVQAFEVNAIDYLLKPIKTEALHRAIHKYRILDKKPDNAIDYRALAEAMKEERAGYRFLLKVGQRIRLVEMKDVAYFFTEDKITFLVTWTDSRLPLDLSLEKLEEIVDPRDFFRINRQYIIHFRSIKDMFAYSKSRVRLELEPLTPQDLIVSTDRSPHFKQWLIGQSAS